MTVLHPLFGARPRSRRDSLISLATIYHLEITTLWSVKNDTASLPCAFKSP